MSIEQDKLLDYLDNQLSEVEKAKVDDALSKDPTLRSQLETYKDMNRFLSMENSKERAFQNLKEVHEEMKSSSSVESQISSDRPIEEIEDIKSKGRSGKSILKLLALIICAIAFFYLGYQFLSKGIGQVKASEAPELMYAANFNPDDISFTTRGIASDQTLLGKAAIAFNKEDYVGAIDMFERAIGLGAMNPRAYYSYSIALIAEGQTDKARLLLEDLSMQNPIYKDDALWYIAMSHLAEGQKQGDNSEARSALAGISKDSKWYKQAFLLLGDLGE